MIIAKIENYWKILSIGIGFSDRNNYGNYKHVIAFQSIVYVYGGWEMCCVAELSPVCMREQLLTVHDLKGVMIKKSCC